MHYRKLDHSASAFLSENVFAIYELDSSPEKSYYKTIPTGIIGLTILLDGQAWSRENDAWQSVPRYSTYGLIRKPSIIKTSADCRDFSIGFQPLQLAQFLKLPMSLITDQFTDAENLFNRQDLDDLRDALLAARQDKQKLAALEKFMRNYFKGSAEKKLISVLEKIARNEYNRVSHLSEDMNVSTRTLLNRFNDKVGLAPKELMQIHRISSSLNIKVHNPDNLTDLAYKLGYFDQSHFIHDFKETLGITPEKYFGSQDLVSDFYNLKRWSFD